MDNIYTFSIKGNRRYGQNINALIYLHVYIYVNVCNLKANKKIKYT